MKDLKCKNQLCVSISVTTGDYMYHLNTIGINSITIAFKLDLFTWYPVLSCCGLNSKQA